MKISIKRIAIVSLVFMGFLYLRSEPSDINKNSYIHSNKKKKTPKVLQLVKKQEPVGQKEDSESFYHPEAHWGVDFSEVEYAYYQEFENEGYLSFQFKIENASTATWGTQVRLEKGVESLVKTPEGQSIFFTISDSGSGGEYFLDYRVEDLSQGSEHFSIIIGSKSPDELMQDAAIEANGAVLENFEVSMNDE